jgi:hypothetical protein
MQSITSLIIGFLLLGGLFVYLSSDPIRTEIKQTVTELTQWTPEKISKNPKNYLLFLQENATESLEDLKTGKVSNSMKLERMKLELSNTSDKLSQAESALEELKALYRNDEFPTSWSTLKYENAGQLKKGIITLAKDIQSWGKKNEAYKVAVSKLEKNNREINSARGKAQSLLSEISTNLEIIAIEEISADIEDTLIDMGAALAGIHAVMSSSTPETLSVEDVSEATSDLADKDFFDSIMSS